jgi:hypothetical protein
MYHGGTNPRGGSVPYLNECALPKLSYDYQAAIGEYGQIRDSYRRAKLLHYFFKDFEDSFCDTKTVLPKDAAKLEPENTQQLRYCLRVHRGRGCLFLNNYQDHVPAAAKNGFSITVHLDGETLRLPDRGGLDLAADASAILPLMWDLGGITLRYATVQPVTLLHDTNGEPWYFFYAIPGMQARFSFESAPVRALEGSGRKTDADNALLVEMPAAETSAAALILRDGRRINLCVLSRKDSLRFWRIKRPGGDLALLCSGTLLDDRGNLRIESIGEETGEIGIFPRRKTAALSGKTYETVREDGVFSYFDVVYGQNHVSLSWDDCSSRPKDGGGTVKRPVIGSPITSTKLTNARAKIRLEPDSFNGCKQILLRVKYTGDIGYAFIDGNLINDNFSNGAPWEFGLKAHEHEIVEKGIYLYISPSRKGSRVCSDSAMAARHEVYEDAFARLDAICALPVFDCPLSL